MATGIGASAQEAANEFERLVNDSLALRKVINANAAVFPQTYTDGYEQYLKSLERFGQSLTPQFSLLSAPTYPLRVVSSAIWLRWYSTDNFNTIQKYKGVYQDYWRKAQDVLGQAPTPNAPAKPQPKQKGFFEEVGDLVKVAVVGGLIVAGIWVARGGSK